MMQETRMFPLTMTIQRGRENSAGKFFGHAAVFNQRTAIGNPDSFGFWEQVAPTAFDRALNEEHDVRFLVDHEPSKVLARTASGTMALRKDKKGLAVEADLADTSIGRDLAILLERGDVSSMSFGFIMRSDSWQQQKDGSELRTIEDLDLFDVSAVTFPAYPQTDAAVRASGLVEIRRQRWAEMQGRFDALKVS